MNWFDQLAQTHLEEAETLEEYEGKPEYDIILNRVIKRGMAIGMFLAEAITPNELKQLVDIIENETIIRE